MASEIEVFFEKQRQVANALFKNILLENIASPSLDSINDGQFVRIGTKTIELDDDSLKEFKAAVSKSATTVGEFCANTLKAQFHPIPNSRFSLDCNRAIKGIILDIIRLLVIGNVNNKEKLLSKLDGVENLDKLVELLKDPSNQLQGIENVINIVNKIKNLNLWDFILVSSAFQFAEFKLKSKINQDALNNVNVQDIKYLVEEEKVIDEIKVDIIDKHILPLVNAGCNFAEEANWAQQKEDLKLEFMSRLLENNHSPYASLRVRLPLRDSENRDINPENPIDDEQFDLIKAVYAAKPVPLDGNTEITAGNKAYSLEPRFNEQIDEVLKGANLSQEQINEIYKPIKMWDLLVMDGVIFNTIKLIKEQLQRDGNAHNKMVKQVQERNESFIKELQQMAFDYYIKPKVHAIKNATQEELKLQFNKAAKMLSVCKSQLASNNVPKEHRATVRTLAEKTALGLAVEQSGDGSKKFDAGSYCGLIASLPLEHKALRIIAGVALTFLGAVLAAAAIMLALHSFGVSTPISALIVALGADMMVTGLAIACAATATLAIGGGVTFFALSKAKSEVATAGQEYADTAPMQYM